MAMLKKITLITLLLGLIGFGQTELEIQFSDSTIC